MNGCSTTEPGLSFYLRPHYPSIKRQPENWFFRFQAALSCAVKRLENGFNHARSCCDAANQAHRASGCAHCAVDLIAFVGTFFTLQSQFFGYVSTLATVLFQLGA